MKNAIVTGATGFIGRHLVEYLCNRGVKVYAVIRDKSKTQILPEDAKIVCDDLSDPERLTLKLNQAGADGADVFYHLAWNGVARRFKNDFQCQYPNLTMSLNSLKSCFQLECRKFVYSGTVAEYVTNDGLIRSDSRPTPNDIYGATKVAVRTMLSAYAKSVNQPIINTILSSVYGEYRQDGSVIPYTIETLLHGQTPSYGDLNQMWSFIYVKDAAYAFFLIGEKGISDRTYAIGTNECRPLHEYICAIKDYIDPTLNLNIGVYQKQYRNVQSSCVDISALCQDTGFEPFYSFESGIRRTIEWFRKEKLR